jgi:Tol biopolymer transport system component
MKAKALIMTAVLMAAIASFPAATQDRQAVFEKALALEEAQGKLQEAIALYQKIVDESKDQALAAQAQLRIGICHEKLGHREAQSAFQKVIENYPGQAEVVAQAKSRLEALRSGILGTEIALTTRLISSTADLWGAVSPDGRFHAYADWVNSSGDVAVRDLASGQAWTITKDARDSGVAPEFVYNQIFSPDSSKIAYSWLNDKEFYELRIVSRNGGAARLLYRDPSSSSILPTDWSQDGRYILATLEENKTRIQYIVRVSVTDGKLERIRAVGLQRPQKTAFSPDGRFIVYDCPQAEGAPNNDIFVVAADGSRQETLIQHPANDHVLGWSPDGRYILFSSDRTGSGGAWRVPISEGRPAGPAVLVKGDIGEVRSFGFSSNGSFYYGTGGWTTDICQVVVDPESMSLVEGPRPLVQRHMGSNTVASWSPDGTKLAYLSIRGKPHPIFLCITSGESEKEIPLTTKLVPNGQPWWYADGRSLLLVGMDDKGRPSLYRIEPEGGAIEKLFEVKARMLGVLLSRNTNNLLSIVNDSDKNTSMIVMRDPQSGTEKEVCRLEKKNTGFWSLALSPDESTLATVIWGEDDEPLRLVKVSVKDGAQTELLKVPPAGASAAVHSLVWTPDGRYILFVRNPAGPPARQVKELWAIPSKGGEAHRVGVRARTIPSVDIHPDGRRIALTLGEYKAQLWIIQNVLLDPR